MIANSRPGLSPMAPVFLVDLFPGLHAELMDLLRGLAPADWSRPTACALWSVKDIAAHLLDSGVRRLSFGRDRSEAAPDTPLSDYSHLVAYLNRLNAEWITAARRLSPQVLIDLLDFTGGQVHAIREAVGAPGLVARRWLQPTLDIFVRALPFAYREVEAPAGSSVRFEIGGEAGGVWTLVHGSPGWTLFVGSGADPDAAVSLDQETAWKLFSKGLDQNAARRRIQIAGDRRLGQPVLAALAIMA